MFHRVTRLAHSPSVLFCDLGQTLLLHSELNNARCRARAGGEKRPVHKEWAGAGGSCNSSSLSLRERIS